MNGRSSSGDEKCESSEISSTVSTMALFPVALPFASVETSSHQRRLKTRGLV